MSINLETVRTIDVHCHPFLANEDPYTEVEFLEKLSLSVLPGMFNKRIRGKTGTLYSG